MTCHGLVALLTSVHCHQFITHYLLQEALTELTEANEAESDRLSELKGAQGSAGADPQAMPKVHTR
jgi:hypothetical protein